jgi:AraC family transcriptional regulator of adaptative response / DNA-3-methyladenine glycosylase II
MLERALAGDAAWDGKFFTAVRTTGIYCLPSCRARKPKPENVTFFATGEEAAAEGFRPCQRCRPDQLAPGRDRDEEHFAALAARVRGDLSAVADVQALVRSSGFGATLVHRGFRRHFHLAPAAWLERERALAARDRLLAGERPALVAAALGYRSPSTFHRQLVAQTGLGPRALGRLRDAGGRFVLTLPPDLRIEDAMTVLARDPASRSEGREGARYLRALLLDGQPALVDLTLRAPTTRAGWQAAVELRGLPARPSPRALGEALAAIFAWFGLPGDPRPFERRVTRPLPAPERAAPGGTSEQAARADGALRAGLARLVARRPGLRVPRMSDPWEALVWAVLGQQVHLAFALALRRSLVELAGTPVPGGAWMAPPSPAAVAALDPADLVRRKCSRRKAEVLVSLAAAVASGELPLDELARGPVARAERTLLARPGIGPWTVGYVGLRGFGFADCLPAGDSALAAALVRLLPSLPRPDARRQSELAAPFAPYRSLLTMHLWLSLGENP